MVTIFALPLPLSSTTHPPSPSPLLPTNSKFETFPLPIKTLLHRHHVSLQEPIPHQLPQDVNSKKDANFENPVGKSSSSSKSSYIWVNSKSLRAKQLGKKSHDARHNSLVKLANSLDSCNPTEHDVSQVLKGLGDKVIEQDVVIVINNMENSVTDTSCSSILSAKD